MLQGVVKIFNIYPPNRLDICCCWFYVPSDAGLDIARVHWSGLLSPKRREFLRELNLSQSLTRSYIPSTSPSTCMITTQLCPSPTQRRQTIPLVTAPYAWTRSLCIRTTGASHCQRRARVRIGIRRKRGNEEELGRLWVRCRWGSKRLGGGRAARGRRGRSRRVIIYS